jgi:thiol-disulfide isomerase/thioredoxin
MPFGAIYGALFFGLFCLWLVFGSLDTAAGSLLAPRLFLALLSFSLGTSLLLRRRWARWGGASFAGALALLSLQLALLGLGMAPFLFLLGSLTAIGLLLFPATGASRAPARPAAPRFGKLLGWGASLGLLGFAASLTFIDVPYGYRVGAGSGGGAATPAASTHVIAERVRWSDFGSGLGRAEGEGKPMMVTFVANWCGYCKKMDRTTWKDPAVVERLSEIVAVRVDVEDARNRNGYTGTELASRYGIHGTPAMMVLDEGGQVVSQTSGYLDPRQFLDWLEASIPGLRESESPDAIRVSAP